MDKFTIFFLAAFSAANLMFAFLNYRKASEFNIACEMIKFSIEAYNKQAADFILMIRSVNLTDEQKAKVQLALVGDANGAA